MKDVHTIKFYHWIFEMILLFQWRSTSRVMAIEIKNNVAAAIITKFYLNVIIRKILIVHLGGSMLGSILTHALVHSSKAYFASVVYKDRFGRHQEYTCRSISTNFKLFVSLPK